MHIVSSDVISLKMPFCETKIILMIFLVRVESESVLRCLRLIVDICLSKRMIIHYVACWQ